jgi:hypothetical protein
MNISTLIPTIENQGYQLSIEGEKITFQGHGRLPESLLNDLRNNKPDLITWLLARDKLARIADSLKYPVDDLIDFYQNDMPDIARMDDDAVAFIVRDYIQYREACRCKPENELNEAT